jgi:hypothetical protein
MMDVDAKQIHEQKMRKKGEHEAVIDGTSINLPAISSGS